MESVTEKCRLDLKTATVIRIKQEGDGGGVRKIPKIFSCRMLRHRLGPLSSCLPGTAPRVFASVRSTNADFRYEPILQSKHYGPETKWKLITKEGIRVVRGADGQDFLNVDRSTITALSRAALTDINFLFRSAHLNSLRNITMDPEASSNDKFVALELLKNASIAASRVLPSCQDTGTATVVAYRGERVLTGGLRVDEEAISRGIYEAYQFNNFRYSQVAPLSMFTEQNTRTNLPCQLDICLGNNPLEYELLYIAKGGGSANKAQLFQV